MVDDDKNFTTLVKTYLERTGEFEVMTVNQGSEGVKAARKFLPDLILLDIMMPDKMGDFVADELKYSRDLKEIPVVFLTAVVTKEKIEESSGTIGGRVFLSKPVALEELKSCILTNIKKTA